MRWNFNEDILQVQNTNELPGLHLIQLSHDDIIVKKKPYVKV